jgi:hypothetical protein
VEFADRVPQFWWELALSQQGTADALIEVYHSEQFTAWSLATIDNADNLSQALLHMFDRKHTIGIVRNYNGDVAVAEIAIDSEVTCEIHI